MPPSLDPKDAYREVMATVRNRLIFGEAAVGGENDLARAERVALHVRKIVEAVAYASLSAAEIRNRELLLRLRKADADRLLKILQDKKMLRLPSAQRPGTPFQGFNMVLEGGGGRARGLDVDVKELKDMFTRASALIHERHPERLTVNWIRAELGALLADLERLRNWLWLHVTFVIDGGLLVQMGQYGTDSFMVELGKVDDPAGTAALMEDYHKVRRR